MHATSQAATPVSAIRPGSVARSAQALEVILGSWSVEPSESIGPRPIEDRSAASSKSYSGTKWSCPSPG
eukprot:9456891-Alexandrium_andersonii.AAC.1